MKCKQCRCDEELHSEDRLALSPCAGCDECHGFVRSQEDTEILKRTLKIFFINDQLWFAALTQAEAIQSCIEWDDENCGDLKENGATVENFPWDIAEEPDRHLDGLTYKEDWFDDSKDKSFRQKLHELIEEGVFFPCFFATNEY